MTRLYGGVRVTNAPSPDNVRRLDMLSLPMLLAMREKGLRIDEGHFKRFGKRMQERREEIVEEIYLLTGRRINPASGDQTWELIKALEIKLPRHLKATPSGDRLSMDDAALEAISPDHPAIPLVQEYRECLKLETTYAEVVPRLAIDGRLHPDLAGTFQVTGRFSARKPNLLAMPKRTDLGRQIRFGFIPSPGRKIISVDFSQIEMRWIAHEGQVKKMMEIFRSGGDIHKETASTMFHTPVDQLDKMKHRLPAKNTGFGVVYDISGKGLLVQMVKSGAQKHAESIGDPWTTEKCDEMIRNWYALYPEVLTHRSEQHSRARRYGMVWDWAGRFKYTPEPKSVHRWVQAEGLRGAGNYPVQSGCNALLRLAMGQVWDQVIVPYRSMIDPLLPPHDELLFEAEAQVAEDFAQWVGEIMRGVMELSVPIDVGISVGDSWGEVSE